MRQKLG
jgi:hypothetical protein